MSTQNTVNNKSYAKAKYKETTKKTALYKTFVKTNCKEQMIDSGYSGAVIKADGRRIRLHFIFNRRLFGTSIAVFAVIFICVAGILNITAEGSETPVEKQYKSVRIEEGDTLWSIAIEYNNEELSNYSTSEYIEDIKDINNLVRDDKITAGNYIIVPVYAIQNQ